MTGRTKRRMHGDDPNASDPDDSDYGVKSTRSPHKKQIKRQIGATSRPRKRRRHDNSDDDIVDSEEDEIESEDPIESASENNSEEDEDEGEFNERTGRKSRKVTKRITYTEPVTDEDGDEESGEGDDDSHDDAKRGHSRRDSSKEQRKLIVKLKISSSVAPGRFRSSRPTTSRRGSKTLKRDPTPETLRTRRSSRLSHDDQDPIVALTDSGRHAQVIRPGTRSPEPVQRRPSRGGKGLSRPTTSAIIEASQEDSAYSRGEDGESLQLMLDSQDRDTRVGGTEDEPRLDYIESVAERDVVAESVHGDVEDEDDEDPVAIPRQSTRIIPSEIEQITTRESQRSRRGGVEESSDFEPAAEEPEEEELSSSDGSQSPKKGRVRPESETSSGERRSRRLAIKKRSSKRSDLESEESGLDPDELAEEAAELAAGTRRRKPRSHRILYDDHQPKLRNRGNKPDYRIFRPELMVPMDEEDLPQTTTPQRGRRTGGTYRSLFSTSGPFGGAGGPAPIFGGLEGVGATGGVDSDSSDDDTGQRAPKGMSGAVGMTPTSMAPHGILPQTMNSDAAQAPSGGPANFGKVKDKKLLADADPLGVDQNVSFEAVGGLDELVDRLKEMVALPLLYPEVFQRFHVTPPRGVLFHGPPGTGKTLLARALASSVSSQGQKVTFYMRKGADALSKWVGEAERQLRLLFEEARKNQPSIIFFDEIDGLAPVRSSKQEQIHASIVATLLALMDGMDGRGQVIVIGATNRPDSVDPALRRPGRFDREFYFPLPNRQARRAIIDIHTKNWDPPLNQKFKDQLAELTNGYGGADLRALCTEAALNAVQGTYPQIYKSDEKLIIDPSTIQVLAKDFMISVNKMVPSSQRSGGSRSVGLEKSVEALLRPSLEELSALLSDAIPIKKQLTALEEAEFDDRNDELGFEREVMQQNFDRRRIYRPRLLVQGLRGMGQQYLGSALLNKFERLHVQSFDLSTLFGDATRTPEAAVVQLFNEVRQHKPSVIYIPDANNWYRTIPAAVAKLFTGLLRSLPSTDPVLVLGLTELDSEKDKLEPDMLREIFGFSPKNQFTLKRPEKPARYEYFAQTMSYIRAKPTDFPEAGARRRREIPQLLVAPAPPPAVGPSKHELKAQKRQDRQTLNLLKIIIQPIMDQIKSKYKKFRIPIVDESRIGYLFDEQNPSWLSTDLPLSQLAEQQYRPFELSKDDKGIPGLLEVETGKFYYNLEIITIEKRLSNGYYKQMKDFLADIKRLAKDARTSGDPERTLKANEMLTNVEVDLHLIEANNQTLMASCEQVSERERMREKLQLEKAKQAQADRRPDPTLESNVPPNPASSTTGQSFGPVILGVPVPGRPGLPDQTPTRLSATSQLTNGYSSNEEHGHGRIHAQEQSSVSPKNDVHMANSQDFEGSPPEAFRTAGSTEATQTQMSQKSALTHIAQNSQPGDYHNSASTTTSEQKASDKSKSTSEFSGNSRSTNGVHSGDRPDFSANPPPPGGSQLPDTQDMTYLGAESSQSPSQPVASAQTPMPPPSTRHVSSVPSLPNKPDHLPYRIDHQRLDMLHGEIVSKTSGCSVEQLEQVQAALMDAIWKTRDIWDRSLVLEKAMSAFNEVISDIDAVQKIQPPSQPENE